jgi:hypothetical protein
VVPWTTVDTTTTKKTALKIVSLCGTREERTKVASTIGTAPRSPAQPRSSRSRVCVPKTRTGPEFRNFGLSSVNAESRRQDSYRGRSGKCTSRALLAPRFHPGRLPASLPVFMLLRREFEFPARTGLIEVHDKRRTEIEVCRPSLCVPHSIRQHEVSPAAVLPLGFGYTF